MAEKTLDQQEELQSKKSYYEFLSYLQEDPEEYKALNECIEFDDYSK